MYLPCTLYFSFFSKVSPTFAYAAAATATATATATTYSLPSTALPVVYRLCLIFVDGVALE